MNAKERELLLFEDELRRGDVRNEHRLFNHAVRVIVFAHAEALNLPLAVKDRLRFLGLEVERTARDACSLERLEERMKALDFREPLADRFKARGLVLESGPDNVVGQTRVRMNHARIELIRRRAAFRAHDGVADHHEAVDAGVEGAEAV